MSLNSCGLPAAHILMNRPDLLLFWKYSVSHKLQKKTIVSCYFKYFHSFMVKFIHLLVIRNIKRSNISISLRLASPRKKTFQNIVLIFISEACSVTDSLTKNLFLDLFYSNCSDSDLQGNTICFKL